MTRYELEKKELEERIEAHNSRVCGLLINIAVSAITTLTILTIVLK